MPVLKNAKHERFAQEVAKGVSGAKAWIAAGYETNANAASVSANRMLKQPMVAARVNELLERKATMEVKATEKAIEKLAITKEKVLAELAKIGFSDIRKVVKWGAAISVVSEDGTECITNGIALVDAKDLTDEAAAAISEIKQTKDGTLTVKLYDKKGALVDLGKHLGLFIDRVEVGGPGDFSAMTDEEIVREIERLADAEIEGMHEGNGTVN